ncbi:prevent-host-death family protein [Roseiarcus fermentans]|uniref:Prevent-host-death family protein n=1 Tax=Roseiarcus fermentans TaxID=1473586 RepID=A0A366FU50_9HYPH|nr:type II toxin-antitoxin system prevent-host-death family antitoxin [Roseiarcus fermentans]RBP18202.1 prevent-host-death family protein [Roseiarcus fermentans]
MREMSVREVDQNLSQTIAAAEQGETIVVTRDGRPVARITPQPRDRADDPEWRTNFAALTESLRAKRGSGRRVGTIREDDLYGDDRR